jgi:hypothetical protein
VAKSEVIIYSYSCDVCGREIPEEDQASAHQVIIWGVNKGSATYELDLCKSDLAKFRKAEGSLDPFLASGHRVAGGPRRQRASSASRPARGKRRGRSADSAAIREWARKNGYEVSDRGRISQALREAYGTAS